MQKEGARMSIYDSLSFFDLGDLVSSLGFAVDVAHGMALDGIDVRPEVHQTLGAGDVSVLDLTHLGIGTDVDR